MPEQSAKFVCLILACCFAANHAFSDAQEKPAAPARPQDFAYAVPLQFEGQDALYQATLPLSVYQHTTRSDLGDLRVFNAQDEAVPHMLQQAERSSAGQPVFSKLAYFPLHGPANAVLDPLSIRVKRNAAGTLIDIGSNAGSAAHSQLSGYLLDTSALKQSIQALELEWTGTKENFVGTVHIESGDDLKHWSTVVRGAPLASLQFDGHSLSQKRVEFSPVRAQYLRLSWPQQQAALQLNGIRAQLSASHIETALSWLSVRDNAPADKAGDYQFDLGAHLPLRRVRIALPQMNTLVRAALFSRAQAGDSWRPAGKMLLYKLHHSGQDLNNPDIVVASNHRYWLLRVEPNNGGLGSGVPELQFGWQPHQLQFVTRGAAPFQLAYGGSEIKPAEFQMQNILPSVTQNSQDLKIQPAQTGAQQTLGGAARLRPAPLPLPWKKWSLWAVLGAAVLLLGWMAYRLLKQLENHDKSKADETS